MNFSAIKKRQHKPACPSFKAINQRHLKAVQNVLQFRFTFAQWVENGNALGARPMAQHSALPLVVNAFFFFDFAYDLWPAHLVEWNQSSLFCSQAGSKGSTRGRGEASPKPSLEAIKSNKPPTEGTDQLQSQWHSCNKLR